MRAQKQVRTNAILVPQRAVTELQGGYQVTVVGSDDKARLQTVRVGNQVGSDWIVEEGLKAGDRVVVEGTQKAKAGTVVKPQPFAMQGNGGPRLNAGQ